MRTSEHLLTCPACAAILCAVVGDPVPLVVVRHRGRVFRAPLSEHLSLTCWRCHRSYTGTDLAHLWQERA